MNERTDPRVEAAARAIAETVFYRNGKPRRWDDMSDGMKAVAFSYAQAALKAADEAAWQQIESAPKDGTQILAYDSGGSVLVEYLNGNWWSDYGCTFDPTHWQPLPAPPETP